ncbi:PKD domain-containing protein [Haloarchaeobius litoreus]|uniref:PKD domain-containing protein n=1 Tax=Haloarchaeobius litoreus TaxID=755306 RepID=A0ABD6DM44_9EURY|nr:PKD domain-containing protein [Haloarchaeobius litoreus]
MSPSHSRRHVLRTAASALTTGGLASAALTGTGAADEGASPRNDTDEPPIAVHGAEAVPSGWDDRYRTIVGREVRFALARMTTMVVRPGGPRVDKCTWSIDGTVSLSGPAVTRTWTTTGTHEIGLTVAYSDGSVARRSLRVDVAEPNEAPLAVPDVYPARWFDDGVAVTAGEIVTYDATGSEDDDGQVVTATWDFDGYVVDGMVVEHEFRRTGPKTVTLSVTDDDGATAETELFVYVERPDR